MRLEAQRQGSNSAALPTCLPGFHEGELGPWMNSVRNALEVNENIALKTPLKATHQRGAMSGLWAVQRLFHTFVFHAKVVLAAAVAGVVGVVGHVQSRSQCAGRRPGGEPLRRVHTPHNTPHSGPRRMRVRRAQCLVAPRARALLLFVGGTSLCPSPNLHGLGKPRKQSQGGSKIGS